MDHGQVAKLRFEKAPSKVRAPYMARNSGNATEKIRKNGIFVFEKMDKLVHKRNLSKAQSASHLPNYDTRSHGSILLCIIFHNKFLCWGVKGRKNIIENHCVLILATATVQPIFKKDGKIQNCCVQK